MAVDSRHGWQSTGLFVEQGATVAVTYRSGTWTIDRRRLGETPFVDSGGYSPGAHPIVYDPTKPSEDFTLGCRILENADHGILIARVGSGEVVPIGKARSLTSAVEGELALSINDEQCTGGDGADCDSGCSSDNEGSITVSVAIDR